MKAITVDHETIDKVHWIKEPSNTVYADGHIEGVVRTPKGLGCYAYSENAEGITVYIPDGY